MVYRLGRREKGPTEPRSLQKETGEPEIGVTLTLTRASHMKAKDSAKIRGLSILFGSNYTCMNTQTHMHAHVSTCTTCHVR